MEEPLRTEGRSKGSLCLRNHHAVGRMSWESGSRWCSLGQAAGVPLPGSRSLGFSSACLHTSLLRAPESQESQENPGQLSGLPPNSSVARFPQQIGATCLAEWWPQACKSPTYQVHSHSPLTKISMQSTYSYTHFTDAETEPQERVPLTPYSVTDGAELGLELMSVHCKRKGLPRYWLLWASCAIWRFSDQVRPPPHTPACCCMLSIPQRSDRY